MNIYRVKEYINISPLIKYFNKINNELNLELLLLKNYNYRNNDKNINKIFEIAEFYKLSINYEELIIFISKLEHLIFKNIEILEYDFYNFEIISLFKTTTNELIAEVEIEYKKGVNDGN